MTDQEKPVASDEKNDEVVINPKTGNNLISLIIYIAIIFEFIVLGLVIKFIH